MVKPTWVSGKDPEILGSQSSMNQLQRACLVGIIIAHVNGVPPDAVRLLLL